MGGFKRASPSRIMRVSASLRLLAIGGDQVRLDHLIFTEPAASAVVRSAYDILVGAVQLRYNCGTTCDGDRMRYTALLESS